MSIDASRNSEVQSCISEVCEELLACHRKNLNSSDSEGTSSSESDDDISRRIIKKVSISTDGEAKINLCDKCSSCTDELRSDSSDIPEEISAMESGDFEYKIDNHSSDEVGLLSQSVNNMSTKIQALMETEVEMAKVEK